MGYAIAAAFAYEGAKVYLVSGPVAEGMKAHGVEILHVNSADEMYNVCKGLIDNVDVAVFNAGFQTLPLLKLLPKR